MKTIIAGSRELGGFALIEKAVKESGFIITEVITGGARGIDWFGKEWARANNLPHTEIKADWNTHGKAAGPIRNTQMTKQAQALIAIWDGASPGTAHMIKEAQKRGLKVFVLKVPPAVR